MHWTRGNWTSKQHLDPQLWPPSAFDEARHIMELATGKFSHGSRTEDQNHVWLSALELQTGLAGTKPYGRLARWLLARETGHFRRFANSK